MLKPVYISHATVISPQHTDDETLLQPVVKDENELLHCISPDYAAVIPPMQLRRMSRILKMGIYAGISCLQKAGIIKPDGIITATGKGSMTDTERFVKDLKTYHEEALNPTPFILSTYNAVNGAIAMQQQATGYNQTYVHRGSSLELALYDAYLKLNECDDTRHYLVGSFDELTEEYVLVKSKTAKWKTDRNNAIPLWKQHDSPGTVAGEGAAFFMMSNVQGKDAIRLHHIKPFMVEDTESVKEEILHSLEKISWNINEIDMLVLGMNGDCYDDIFYQKVLENFPDDLPVMLFKHLSGEYETATGFALWLVMQYLNEKKIPPVVWYNHPPQHKPKKVMFYNHFQQNNHNILLLSKD